MKKFLIILVAVLLSAPLSSLISSLIAGLIMGDVSSFLLGVIIFTIYEVPIYIVVGLPVTLLIDFVLKLTGVSNSKNKYLYQFLLYSLVTVVLGLYLYSVNENWNNTVLVIISTVAIYTYFHILYFLRKKFN